ncbi:MAG: dipeptide/oligopeptide/nickel ABC transporter permease/ATP-binding protein [Jatrophihabitans sp.]|uniref:dipeptide/oligopeptide/nickel ABC transporter permease/ATP-binding protein n=1 Tax=Jatrophihabitans sp. TaxID=1932789 RepID=UPI003F7DF600
MTVTDPAATVTDVASTSAPSPIATSFRAIARRPLVIVSAAWLLVIVISSALASVLASADPLDQDLRSVLQGPTGHHLLGTDELGRDLLSRLLHGGGGILFVALIPVVIAFALGVPAGLLAGYVGGKVDVAVSFIGNVFLATPVIVAVLAAAVITDNDVASMMVVLGVLLSAGMMRLVRSSTSSVRELLFVDAARVAGLPRRRILRRHILPNVLGPVIVQSFLLYGGAFLVVTSLSFLGLGFAPEQPSWGQLVLDASAHIETDPWLMVPVGVVLIATILAVNTVGTALLTALPTAHRTSLLPRARRPRDTRPQTARVDSRPPDGRASQTAPPKSLRSTKTDAAPPAQEAQPTTLLRVTDLGVAFTMQGQDQLVVDQVSFEVAAGQTLGLVGESGCGKTMTALALLGLVPPPGRAVLGQVWLSGVDLLTLDEPELARIRGRQIGFVAQEPMVALDPCFTVESLIREPLRHHLGLRGAAARSRVHELLRLVGIADPPTVAKRYAHQLSGGMAQRVGIALALAGEPKLLIADEPTTALDVTVQADILDLLRRLQREMDMGLVLVTHDFGVVADICDAVAVMYAGEIVEMGSVGDVFAHPAHPYTRTLLMSTPSLSSTGTVSGLLDGTVPRPQDWPDGCRFAARCSLADERCHGQLIPLHHVGDGHAARCIRTGQQAVMSS